MRLHIAAVAALLVAGLVAPSAASATAFAVTEEAAPRLVSFDPATPGQLVTSVALSGLAAGETVRGLDLRPVNGALHLLTTDALGTARLHTVDPGTGVVSAPLVLSADPTDATSPYTSFDPANGVAVDFNPVSDRLRVVTGSGVNLRVNPANGLVITDGAINPGTPVITGAAYLNSFPGTASTTLYVIDYSIDSLAIQNPPNNGTIVSVGPLGIITGSFQNLAFDVSPDGNAAYLVALSGAYGLYSVNLTTGAATLIGRVGDGATPIRGFTVAENVIRPVADAALGIEGGSVVRVTVERSSPHLGASVDYATADGSATAGADYDARSGTLVFAPGEVTKTIEIPLRDDAAAESAKSFSVSLSNPDPDLGATATLAGPSSVTVTLADNDASSGGPGPGPDRVKPKLLALASAIRRGALRRGGLGVRFSCSEACTVRARLLAGRRAIATSTRRLTAADLGTLRLRPSRRGAAAIGRRRGLKVALVATDAAGNATRHAFSVRLL
ncbi:MAG TPA: DUF4394 domain-containing protein [Conexibacter sp.]|nr:DUF4394 domain-containing protein [Conexibacter sp.]